MNRLKAIRQDIGVTQEQMANYLNMPKRTYQHNEAKSELKLSEGKLFKISLLHHTYALYVVGVCENLNLSKDVKNSIKSLNFGDKK